MKANAQTPLKRDAKKSQTLKTNVSPKFDVHLVNKTQLSVDEDDDIPLNVSRIKKKIKVLQSDSSDDDGASLSAEKLHVEKETLSDITGTSDDHKKTEENLSDKITNEETEKEELDKTDQNNESDIDEEKTPNIDEKPGGTESTSQTAKPRGGAQCSVDYNPASSKYHPIDSATWKLGDKLVGSVLLVYFLFLFDYVGFRIMPWPEPWRKSKIYPPD